MTVEKIEDISIDLERYLAIEDKTKIVVKKPDLKYYNIVYFLINKGDIVYVGKSTKGLARPWSHRDKEWDSFEYIKVHIHTNLSVVEQYYIDKYKPKYNKSDTAISRKAWSKIKTMIKNRNNNEDT